MDVSSPFDDPDSSALGHYGGVSPMEDSPVSTGFPDDFLGGAGGMGGSGGSVGGGGGSGSMGHGMGKAVGGATNNFVSKLYQ